MSESEPAAKRGYRKFTIDELAYMQMRFGQQAMPATVLAELKDGGGSAGIKYGAVYAHWKRWRAAQKESADPDPADEARAA